MDNASTLQALNPSNVVRAYVGKPGCACGCRGTYYSNADNSAMVTKVLRTLQANEEIVTADCNWMEARIKGKDYVIYLSDE